MLIISNRATEKNYFQELIRKERARELQEQRMAEELNSGNAALKELAAGHRNQA